MVIWLNNFILFIRRVDSFEKYLNQIEFLFVLQMVEAKNFWARYQLEKLLNFCCTDKKKLEESEWAANCEYELHASMNIVYSCTQFVWIERMAELIVCHELCKAIIKNW